MKKSLQIALSMTIVILLTASCSLSVGTSVNADSSVDDWPMFHHDLAHTGYSTSTAPTTNQTLWIFTTGDAVTTSPSVVDGLVYFGSDDGNVYAVNASSGALIWNYSTGGPVQSSPSVLDGVVYIGGFHSHAVYALNASSGVPLWNSPINSSYPNIVSSTAVANGFVYVDVSNVDESGGRLYALNATTGILAWQYQPGAWLTSSPAVYGDMVYIGTSTGNVVSLNAKSGNVLWSYYVREDGSNSPSGSGYGPVSSSMSISKGFVYFGVAAEMVQALNASTGAFVWSGRVVGGVSSSCAAVSNGMVYQSTTYGGNSSLDLHAGGVCALNATTGTLLWTRTVGSITQSSPAVADGIVYVGSDSATLNYLGGTGPFNFYALNATTGTILWTYTADGPIYSSPAIANGAVYVGSNDGKVYAFGTTQNTLSPMPSASPTSSPNPSPSVPEFPTWIILPLLTAATASFIALRKRVR